LGDFFFAFELDGDFGLLFVITAFVSAGDVLSILKIISSTGQTGASPERILPPIPSTKQNPHFNSQAILIYVQPFPDFMRH
jgi:hypothetical protein